MKCCSNFARILHSLVTSTDMTGEKLLKILCQGLYGKYALRYEGHYKKKLEIIHAQVCDIDVLSSADPCQWSVWGQWSVCQEPCSGGFRQRERIALAATLGPQCTQRQSQSQSCNTGLCPSMHLNTHTVQRHAYCI